MRALTDLRGALLHRPRDRPLKGPKMTTFEIGEQAFLLDAQPFQIISGALHYFRVHPDLWADRIHKARLMGLNTIETYVAWNLHAPQPAEFSFSGGLDLDRFLSLVQDEGLHAIVRPGPYICAELDGGGVPAWLFARRGVGIRRSEPVFLEAIAEYYAHVLPLVAAHQVTRGGPVLAVQVENEYGAYGSDAHYLEALVTLTREAGIDVPLLSCDQADDEMLARGSIPGLHRTATFGSRALERLAVLRRHQPRGPLMCMEFWNGWFDSWGGPHHVAAPEVNARDLDELLASGASVNLYMFHGGTNFGLTSGANDKGRYEPVTTSYDYDAPLAEDGGPTAKYWSFRDVIGKHAPVPSERPDPVVEAPVRGVTFTHTADLLGVAAALPVRTWTSLPTMDAAGQWTGVMLYRTSVQEDDAVISFAEVRDRAQVFLDGAPVGVISRTEHSRTITLPRRAGVLDVLVEDQGRVNYGPRLGEPKGLVGPARTAQRELTHWQTTTIPLDRLAGAVDDLVGWTPLPDAGVPVAGPVLCRGTLTTDGGRDHFWSTDGWQKGFVWVNGFLLGRYWSAGPTRTLYIPGPLLRDGENELVVLELLGARSARGSTVDAAVLGSPER